MGNKKLLITGANGFVGSFLVEHAINEGYDTYIGIRKSSDLTFLDGLSFGKIFIDFENEELLRAQLVENKFDYIIHNAGITRAKSEAEFHKVNASYVYKMGKLLIEENIIPKKFVFTSSLASYGPADNTPDNIVNYKVFPKPITQYGRSKLQAEEFLYGLKKLPVLIFRPTAVYGPREKDIFIAIDSINKGICLKIGKETQLGSFIYVKDLASLMVKSLSSDVSQKGYFVSDGNTYPIKNFNALISNILNKKPLKLTVPISFLKPIAYISETLGRITGKSTIINRDKVAELSARNWNCDIKDLKEDFDWEPKYSLEQGMKETIEWYKREGWIK